MTLCVIVSLRPLISETFAGLPDRTSQSIRDLAPVSPLRTLILDAIILFCAAVYWAMGPHPSALRPESSRRMNGFKPVPLRAFYVAVLLLFIIAAALSTVAADDKRLALNAGLDWICSIVLMGLVAGLCHVKHRAALLFACILGAMTAQAWECCDQVFLTFPMNREFYQETRAEFWERQGIALDDPQVRLFEARLDAAEASGFLSHSSVAGGYLAAGALLAIGLAAAAVRSRAPTGNAAAAIGLASLLLLAVGLTRSIGAIAAIPLALLAAGASAILRRRLGWSGKRIFFAGVAAAVVLVAAVIGHGLTHGGLPGSALNFRWQYWTLTLRIIAETWLTGVGRENFIAHYLPLKPIEFPEEIHSPHNVFLQVWAEWGVAGLFGVLLLILFIAYILLAEGDSHASEKERSGFEEKPAGRPSRPVGARPSDRAPSRSTEKRRGAFAYALARTPAHATSSSGLWASGAFIGILIFIVRIPLLGSASVPYVYAATLPPLLAWEAGFALTLSALSSRGHSRWARLPLLGLSTALLAFLIQDSISFAAFIPGVGVTVFAIIGLALAITQPAIHGNKKAASADDAPEPEELDDPNGGDLKRRPLHPKLPRRLNPWLRWSLALSLYAITFLTVLWPPMRCNRLMARANIAQPLLPGVPLERQPVFQRLAEAAQADPLDPAPLIQQSRWLLACADAFPDQALHALDLAREPLEAAMKRSGRFTAAILLDAERSLRIARITRNESDFAPPHERLLLVVTDLYPQNPAYWIRLADLEFEAAEATRQRSWFEAAAKSYDHALDLESRRPNWEVLRRLSPEQIREIERKRAEARARLQAAPEG